MQPASHDPPSADAADSAYAAWTSAIERGSAHGDDVSTALAAMTRAWWRLPLAFLGAVPAAAPPRAMVRLARAGTEVSLEVIAAVTPHTPDSEVPDTPL